MNYIDVIILTTGVYFSFLGFKRGIIKEISAFLALFLAAYIAIFFSQQINNLLNNLNFFNDNLVPAISFAMFFITTYFIVKAFGSFVDKFFKLMALGLFTRLFGAIFGALKSLILLAFIWFVVDSYYSVEDKMKKESQLLTYIEKTLELISSNAKSYSDKDFKAAIPGNSSPSK